MTAVINAPYDVEQIQKDFPILQQEHSPGKRLVYLDNAASSQHPMQVINAMTDYYLHTHANVHRGIHKLSEAATVVYEGARDKIQRFINASSRQEVIFTRGTTESINLVAFTWGQANLKAGDVVITSQMEHHSNIVPWQMLAEKNGFTIKYIPILEDGLLDLEAYGRFLEEGGVKLVTVVHASNVLGTINPVTEMAKQAHAAGAVFMLDAAQSVPHMPIDVQALDVDFMAFSSHKMVGPTGIGILYGKRDLLDAMPPFMGGGDMIATVGFDCSTWNDLPYKFEAGTPSIAEAVGFGAAVDYLNAIGMENIHAYEKSLTNYAMDRLAEVSGVKVFGPDAALRGGVIAFELDGFHAHDLAEVIDLEGVAVRSGHHCAMPLHGILGSSATARASLYLYNLVDDVDQLIDALERAKAMFT